MGRRSTTYEPRRPGLHVGGRHERVDFFPREEGNGPSQMTLGRDRENPTTAVRVGRFADGHIPKERVEGSETDIACAGAVRSLALDVVEKLPDKSRVEILKRQRRRLFPEPLERKPKDQTKRIPVGGDRVRARLPLAEQSVREEALEEAGKRGLTS